MRGFLGLAPHTVQNTAIFLRSPRQAISNETDNEHFHHTRLSATAKVPGFDSPVSFINVHLCPDSAHIRLREAGYLCAAGTTH